MEQRTIGNTDLVTSTLGFGTWEMSTTSYGEIDVGEAVRLTRCHALWLALEAEDEMRTRQNRLESAANPTLESILRRTARIEAHQARQVAVVEWPAVCLPT